MFNLKTNQVLLLLIGWIYTCSDLYINTDWCKLNRKSPIVNFQHCRGPDLVVSQLSGGLAVALAWTEFVQGTVKGNRWGRILN